MNTPNFFDQLETRVRAVDSLLCLGLDPHPADLPEQTAAAAKAFCMRLIAAAGEDVAAFKPNAAFFERFGAEGWQALREVIAAIPAHIPVILDAKRGDIASTAAAYAEAAFDVLRAGAITLSPYLGHDSLEPFLRDASHGCFILCKTSNPGAADLQDLILVGENRLLYEEVARLAQTWNTRGNLGLVVGATQTESLRRARAAAPDLWFLAPGVGAQGGDLRSALNSGLRADGLGMLINVSRGIARAADPRQAIHEVNQAVREEQARLDRNRVGGTVNLPITIPAEPAKREVTLNSPGPVNTAGADDLADVLADALLRAGCVRFGEFTLKSGLTSPIYMDLRQLISYPDVLADVARAYHRLLRPLTFDRLAALPYAALPIATAISLQSGWPMIYPRKEAKEYGTRAVIEGEFAPGDHAVIIDDLATTGSSKFEAIEKLTAAGLVITDVVVLIDRQSGAAETLAQAGYRMHAVFTLTQLLNTWETFQQVPSQNIAAVRAFVEQTRPHV